MRKALPICVDRQTLEPGASTKLSRFLWIARKTGQSQRKWREKTWRFRN